MRAGHYAELDGRVFRAGNPARPRVRLFASSTSSRPEGFQLDRGEWTRLVDRQGLMRLFHVRTTAVWRGQEVAVLRILEDEDEAFVDQWSCPPPDGATVSVVDNGHWTARVPVSELSDVSEQVTELPR